MKNKTKIRLLCFWSPFFLSFFFEAFCLLESLTDISNFQRESVAFSVFTSFLSLSFYFLYFFISSCFCCACFLYFFQSRFVRSCLFLIFSCPLQPVAFSHHFHCSMFSLFKLSLLWQFYFGFSFTFLSFFPFSNPSFLSLQFSFIHPSLLWKYRKQKNENEKQRKRENWKLSK